jgi:predicted XRE-type DNA-binding protein
MSSKRSDDTKIEHVTPADGNVFADLGFPADQAKQLLKAADARIAHSRKLKKALALEIAAWIDAQHLTQVAASKILAVSRPRVSDLVNAKLSRFSLDTLVSMLYRVGKVVEMEITDAVTPRRHAKHTSSDRRAAAA